MKVYNAYCKSNQNSKLCIDATGSVVKRIRWLYREKSKHIFLYEAVVNDEISGKQYSVSNMLSEVPDNNMIYH